jgi:large subunit GTPase 1
LDKSAMLAPTYLELNPLDAAERVKFHDRLSVPRRPAWRTDMPTEELLALERESFLQWRRSLAELEANNRLKLTPFEKNIDVWRQLWRVLERSELVCQIVDARDPLLFRSADLERYVRELPGRKRTLLIVNKADLLTERQRAKWVDFWKANGVRAVFWSAVIAQSVLDAEAKAEQQSVDLAFALANGDVKNDDDDDDGDDDDGDDGDTNDDDHDDDDEAVDNTDESKEPNNDETAAPATAAVSETPSSQQNFEENPSAMINTTHVATRDELIALLVAECPPSQWRKENPNAPRVAGFVGYPNVGKSSTINVLMAEKKTGVTSTPGKTKHFQTLMLSSTLMLCDCPGLVMPSFALSTPAMYLNGLLPIDRMREYETSASLLALRIGRARLESFYVLRLPDPNVADGEAPDRPPTGMELLEAYAASRGYTTGGRGLPDTSRSVRYVLKDYTSGALLFCEPPPGQQWSEDDVRGGGMELPREPPQLPRAHDGVVHPSYEPVTLEEVQEYQADVGVRIAGRQKARGKKLKHGAVRL